MNLIILGIIKGQKPGIGLGGNHHYNDEILDSNESCGCTLACRESTWSPADD